jgi:hypothetical protein
MNLAAGSGEGQQDPYTREVLAGERDRAVPVQTAYAAYGDRVRRARAGRACRRGGAACVGDHLRHRGPHRLSGRRSTATRAARAEPGGPGVRVLHVRDDRAAEGHRDPAPRDRAAHLQALVKTRIQEGSSQALEDCTEHEIQNVMASVVHPHFRERLGQFRDKTMRSSAVVVDLDRHEAGMSTS